MLQIVKTLSECAQTINSFVISSFAPRPFEAVPEMRRLRSCLLNRVQNRANKYIKETKRRQKSVAKINEMYFHLHTTDDRRWSVETTFVATCRSNTGKDIDAISKEMNAFFFVAFTAKKKPKHTKFNWNNLKDAVFLFIRICMWNCGYTWHGTGVMPVAPQTAAIIKYFSPERHSASRMRTATESLANDFSRNIFSVGYFFVNTTTDEKRNAKP